MPTYRNIENQLIFDAMISAARRLAAARRARRGAAMTPGKGGGRWREIDLPVAVT